MEDDLFQGDLQEYLENGDLYTRCNFQWSLIQSMVMGSHILLEMHFPDDKIANDYMSSDLAHQTARILERAVTAVIKGALIKSICFTTATTIEEVQRVTDQISHGKCSVLIAYNLSAASSPVQSYFYNVYIEVSQERLFCCIVAVRYAVYTYPCSEGMTVLSYPCCVDPLYLNLFHISIPLTITDESMSTIWDLLGLVEIQAKLTEDLNNGLSCDKDEEELKRNMYLRLSVDELREIKMNVPRIYMSLDIRQRIVELIVAIRQHPMVVSFSPRNSLNFFITTACLSALIDGKTFVLPRHIE
ncbi:hypothetical protein JH06_3256 [Blastocystis sp. subtype 4]|uniref:hypothetical protein n=1 Tax=Blastocystis sp. subtype 4 TaxID=944170 RepID=UPI00071165C7|nr:hypothetical protein JH06_3256 [Blastocystis sp. subtype 4]KNB43894.1 hypothetical protein JH06_3256 [Blastocystis sp. subtype 4]|eukprot:XP_014527332.1 hypothetical protein JH06_3256 [Blastocystis sp. subtype 4]